MGTVFAPHQEDLSSDSSYSCKKQVSIVPDLEGGALGNHWPAGRINRLQVQSRRAREMA